MAICHSTSNSHNTLNVFILKQIWPRDDRPLKNQQPMQLLNIIWEAIFCPGPSTEHYGLSKLHGSVSWGIGLIYFSFYVEFSSFPLKLSIYSFTVSSVLQSGIFCASVIQHNLHFFKMNLLPIFEATCFTGMFSSRAQLNDALGNDTLGYDIIGNNMLEMAHLGMTGLGETHWEWHSGNYMLGMTYLGTTCWEWPSGEWHWEWHGEE